MLQEYPSLTAGHEENLGTEWYLFAVKFFPVKFESWAFLIFSTFNVQQVAFTFHSVVPEARRKTRFQQACGGGCHDELIVPLCQ